MSGPEIPEVMRLEAVNAGLSANEIGWAWARYCQWHSTTNLGEWRMVDWRRNLQWAVERKNGTAKRPSGPVPADPWSPEEKARREAQAASDAEYAKHAVSLDVWLRDSATDEEIKQQGALRAWMGWP